APVGKALAVKASDNGGIRVQPSTDGSCSATICMAAGAESSEQGEKLLDQLSVQQSDDELTVIGPDGAAWAAHILLWVPKDVILDLTSGNGELSMRDVSGRFKLQTTNGPIALKNVVGEVDAEAVNGPIDFHGHAGDVHLTAQNGPIDVKLDGAT